jgi:hypothetical protein
MVNEQTRRICRNWHDLVIRHCRHCVGWLEVQGFWDALIPLYQRWPTDTTPWGKFCRQEISRKFFERMRLEDETKD